MLRRDLFGKLLLGHCWPFRGAATLPGRPTVRQGGTCGPTIFGSGRPGGQPPLEFSQYVSPHCYSSSGLFSTLSPDASRYLSGAYLIVLGVGLGLWMQVFTLIVQNTAPARDMGPPCRRSP